MDYKSHISLLQDALSMSVDYRQSSSLEAVVITREGLLEARTKIKTEMEKIVNEVDLLSVPLLIFLWHLGMTLTFDFIEIATRNVTRLTSCLRSCG